MATFGIALGGHVALGQRMPGANDADIAIDEQRLRAHFGADRASDDARLEVDVSLAKTRAVLVQLADEADANMRLLRFGMRRCARSVR